MSITELIQSENNRKVAKFADASQGGKRIRQFDEGGFNVGDEFTINVTENGIYLQQIGNNNVSYTLVDVNGTAKHFYPGCLSKNVMIANEQNVFTGQSIHATGTAVEEYMRHKTVDEGMAALEGKTLRITNIQWVLTIPYRETKSRSTSVMTIDIVE